MAKLKFTKMQGTGNDYIYLLADHVYPADPPALARRLSNRRFGVGGDGLIMLLPPRTADVRMEVYNADGSRAEMCGNGIRCLARLAYERGVARKNPLVVETDAGPKTVWLEVLRGRVTAATVDMGEPVVEGSLIPTLAQGRVVDYPLEVDGHPRRVTAVSMGNPHCVVFVDDDAVFELDAFEFARLGRKFESHPFFPRRVNTEFVRARSPRVLRMRVFERGSGETMACGTGACAAVVAAVLTGRGGRAATVELSGGRVEVEWRESGAAANHVFMTGDAVEVFTGEVEVDAGELVGG